MELSKGERKRKDGRAEAQPKPLPTFIDRGFLTTVTPSPFPLPWAPLKKGV